MRIAPCLCRHNAGGVGELPFEGARCQNIENNPMQSNLPPEKQLDPSGKSPA
jgi:hypothetical protein